MRPISLELQAFGPFKDKIFIDFTEFEQDSLFLICGPTGAGKTSIFDAIFYALYGQLSSSDRKSLGQPAKSQFASDETLCYVEFVFETKGQKVKIYRHPEQFAIGARTRIVKHLSSVKLTSDKVVLDKSNEVQNYVNELLGLSANQFKQIVLLPQGEFKDLLMASSSQKEEIFRDLFNTHEIQQFTENLKNEAITLTQQLKESKNNVIAYTKILNIEDEQFNAYIESQQVDLIVKHLDEIIIEQKEKQSQLSSLLDKDVQKLETIKEQINLQDDFSNYETKLKLFEEQEASINQLKINNQKIKELIELEKQLVNIQNLQTKINLNKESLANLENKIKETSSQQDQLNKQLESVITNFNKIDEWENSASSLEKDIVHYESLLIKLNSKLNLEKLNHSSIEIMKNLDTELEVLADEFNTIKESLFNIDQASIKKEELSIKINQLNEIMLKLSEKEKHFNQINGLMSNINQEQLIFNDLRVKKENIDSEVTQSEIIRQEQIAGVLASELKDNEPCPVCGSLHHPNKAHLTNNVISDEDLKNLKVSAQKILQKFIESSQKIGSYQQQIQEFYDQLKIDAESRDNEFEKLTIELNNVKEQNADFNQELEDLNKQLSTKTSLEKRKDEINDLIIQKNLQKTKEESTVQMRDADIKAIALELKDQTILSKEQINELATQVSTIKNQIQQTRSQKTEGEKQLHEIELKLIEVKTNHSNLNELLVNQVSDLEKLEEQFNIDLRKKGLTLEEVQDNKNTLQTILDYETQIEQFYQQKNQTIGLYNNVQEKLEKIKELVEFPHSLSTQLTSEIQQQTEVLNKVNNYLSTVNSSRDLVEGERIKSEKLLKAHQEIYPLYLVASGDRSVGYLSFERYVLSTFFEEVLEFANQRLLAMTQDRYYLIVQQESMARQRSSGLDLEVFDNNSSQSRSVKTLSGGETFKASLALALGLSDVISQRSGGVQIDALFIDEGFGTLDDQSLDQAIETLLSINQGGRLVGIISHVKELRERIENQIQVFSTNEGSYIKVIS